VNDVASNICQALPSEVPEGGGGINALRLSPSAPGIAPMLTSARISPLKVFMVAWLNATVMAASVRESGPTETVLAVAWTARRPPQVYTRVPRPPTTRSAVLFTAKDTELDSMAQVKRRKLKLKAKLKQN